MWLPRSPPPHRGVSRLHTHYCQFRGRLIYHPSAVDLTASLTRRLQSVKRVCVAAHRQGESMKSDAQLIREARDNPDAFAELYLRHRAALYRWLRKRASEPVAAELTAETFAQAGSASSAFGTRQAARPRPGCSESPRTCFGATTRRNGSRPGHGRPPRHAHAHYDLDLDELSDRADASPWRRHSPRRSADFPTVSARRSSSESSANAITARSRPRWASLRLPPDCA